MTGVAAAGSAPSLIGDLFGGVALLGRGLGRWARAPRLMLLGAVPAVIVAVVYAVGLVALAINSPAIADWATPFADGWDEPWRSTVRISAALALVAAGVLLVVFTFTAITLAAGDAFYERIWRDTEERLGDAPAGPQAGFWRLLWRGIVNAVRLVALSVAIGLGLFVVGLLPVVGTIAAAVLGAFFGGWVLALELTGYAFDARGHALRGRRRMLGVRRARTVGFGAAVYLLFLLPLGAVFVMPAAVVGATLLAREALDAAGRPATGAPGPVDDEAGRHP